MEPMTALAILTSLGGTLASSSNNANAMASAAQNLQYQMQRDSENLAFQKDQANKADQVAAENTAYSRGQADKIEHFNQASRTDAYGNVVRYDPATNQWVTDLTDQQKKNVSAGEQEQLRTLTTDAVRNRQLRDRQDQNSLNAETPMRQALAGYQYDKPPSEDGINAKLTDLMLAANQDKVKQGQDVASRQALRFGRGQDIPQITKTANDSIGDSTADIMLKARNQAMQEYLARNQAHDAKYLPEISKFQSIIDDAGGNAPQTYSSTPQSLSNTEAQGANTMAQSASAMMTPNNSMLNAIKAASSGVNSALTSQGSNTASDAFSKLQNNKVDLNSLAKIMAGIKPTKTDQWDQSPAKVDYSTTPDYLGDITYGRTDSQGNLF